ncbi:MAG: hypothetical protein KDK70_33515 [Myxococcales bacterium]|nr:hypothetical protein [Myxococcales bacterium]
MRWRGVLLGSCVVSVGCFDPPLDPLDPSTTGGPTSGSTTDALPPVTTSGVTVPTSAEDSTEAPLDCLEDADCSGLDDACVVGTCEGGTCTARDRPDGTACDDQAWCTENDACMGGQCTGQARECETTDLCRVGACNERTDSCEQAPDPAQDGDPCDDGDPCTDDGTCGNGECQPGPDACALQTNECRLATCGERGCEFTNLNESLPCDQTNPCAQSTCQAGTCTLVGAINENGACDDGLWCTYFELCIAGVCTPGPQTPCPGDQGCGAWTCDDALDACVVAPANEGAGCDDGISCTGGTQCQMGECTGGVEPLTVFEEHFADNAQGWTLGPEWEIGPAQQTPCNQEQNCFEGVSAYPGGDPDLDHTLTDDNGLAGAVIGGIVGNNVHPHFYLESPPFDGNVAGALVLSFYRWLDSDYTPYMENRVEVFDGVAWQLLWASGPAPPIVDAPWSMSGSPAMGWSYQEFDVTAYKNAQMRVRFGYNVGQSGVYPAPGWSVDDVRVAATGCPDDP